MLIRDQSIDHPVQEEAWALCLLNAVDVSEPLINEQADHRASPAEETFGCIFDTRIGAHQQQTVAVLAASQVAGRPTTHASTEQNHILVFNAADCC